MKLTEGCQGVLLSTHNRHECQHWNIIFTINRNQENMHFLLKYQRYNIQRGWSVFMVKIFLNLNYTCGYCLNLDNCTKRLNCRTVKNQQLNESFVNCTRCSHWAQCGDDSRDSSAVSSRGEYYTILQIKNMHGSYIKDKTMKNFLMGQWCRQVRINAVMIRMTPRPWPSGVNSPAKLQIKNKCF